MGNVTRYASTVGRTIGGVEGVEDDKHSEPALSC